MGKGERSSGALPLCSGTLAWGSLCPQAPQNSNLVDGLSDGIHHAANNPSSTGCLVESCRQVLYGLCHHLHSLLQGFLGVSCLLWGRESEWRGPCCSCFSHQVLVAAPPSRHSVPWGYRQPPWLCTATAGQTLPRFLSGPGVPSAAGGSGSWRQHPLQPG